MGLGTSKRLYGDEQIAKYDAEFEKPLFLIASSLQAINDVALSKVKNISALKVVYNTPMGLVDSFKDIRKKWRDVEQRRAEELKAKGYKVITATELEQESEFQEILSHLRKAYGEMEGVQSVVEGIISKKIMGMGELYQKFGQNHEVVERILAEYVLHEIAHTFYFAKQGYCKAGHKEEKLYDLATEEIARIKELRKKIGVKFPDLKFRRLA